MISENPLIQALDRMVGPIPDPDPVQVQVQGELHAYLIQRVQQVAQDLGMAIDLFTPEELAELGRLDLLGTMPDVPQDLALHLARPRPRPRPRQAVASWHEQRERHRGHHHAANETCTVPAWTRPRRRPRSPSDRRLRSPILGFRPVRTMARMTTLGAVRTFPS
jgi:hypothetical protein